MVHENDQHNDNDDSDTSLDAHSCREVDHVDVDTNAVITRLHLLHLAATMMTAVF